ncbi:MAG: AAA family ATPase, partial [Clostridiales bacterium]|nr:AAA family ATPase [Clostridiales bacterium]
IQGFGKIVDKFFTLGEGVNLLYGPNETGKTTLLSFIKAMFYGIDGRSRENTKEKYSPWYSDSMGGYIKFEHSGTEYVLQRDFGNSRKTDNISFFNELTGEPITLNDGQEVGEYIFGMSRGAFENSLYIPQTGNVVNTSKDKSGEIISKLTALGGNGTEDSSVKAIEKRLKDAMGKLRTPRSGNGIIDRLEVRRNELLEKLNDIEELNRHADELRVLLDEQETQADESEKQLKLINRSIDVISAKQVIDEKNKILNAVSESDGYKERLNAYGYETRFFNSEGLAECRSLDNRINNLEGEVTNLQSEIAITEERLDKLNLKINELKPYENSDALEINALNSKIEENKDILNETFYRENNTTRIDKAVKNKNRILNIFLIVSVVISLAGLLGLVLNMDYKPFWILLILIGLVLIIFSTFNKSEIKKADKTKIFTIMNELEAEKTKILSNWGGTDEKMKEYVFKLKSYRDQEEDIESHYHNLESRLIESKETLNDMKVSLLGKYSLIWPEKDLDTFSREELLDDYEKETLDFERISRENEQYDSILTNFLNGETPDALKPRWERAETLLASLDSEAPLIPGTVEELEKLSTEVNLALIFHREQRAAISAQINLIRGENGFPEETAAELEEINASLEGYRRYYNVLEIACENITAAFEEVQKIFGPALNLEVSNILKKLTAGKYDKLRVTRDFDISVTEVQTERLIDSAVLSGGTFEQIFFAFRLAVAKLISAELPLFLDDVFSEFDDIRLKYAADFLLEYSKERDVQVILCTCRQKVAEAFTGGINRITM